MKNWSTKIKTLQKDPEKFRLWKTEQLINFGLGKAKLESQYLRANLSKLDIDPSKKQYISFLLCGKKSLRAHRKSS